LIAKSHFTRIADEHGVDAKTVERDYVLTHVLTVLGPLPDTQNMIFKGGTALRMCYFEEYRYSADLDFSLINGMTVAAALTPVSAALEATKQLIGFPSLALTEDGKHIEYVGPLGKQRDVKLDLADDERVENTATRPLLHRYPDQAEAEIPVYALDEVGAEKLRCVIHRLQARDLFDLNELLVGNELDASAIWPLFERKARHRRIDPARFADMFEKRVPQWKARWQAEMETHLAGDPQPFNGVERAVRRALREQLHR
jgi:predicted nucleotidyltransferase component of viral defense system